MRSSRHIEKLVVWKGATALCTHKAIGVVVFSQRSLDAARKRLATFGARISFDRLGSLLVSACTKQETKNEKNKQKQKRMLVTRVAKESAVSHHKLALERRTTRFASKTIVLVKKDSSRSTSAF